MAFNLQPIAPKPLQKLLLIFAGAIIYVIVAKLSLNLSHKGISPFWPPTGIATTLLIAIGPLGSLGVWVAAFFANGFNGVGIATAIATGNACEALVISWLFRLLCLYRDRLDTLTYPVAFLVAGSIGSSFSATIGTTALLHYGLIDNHSFFSNLLIWWSGDLIGLLTVAPLLLFLRTARRDRLNQLQWIGTILTCLVSIGLNILLFKYLPESHTLLLLFPLIVVAGVFSPLGIYLTGASICATSFILTSKGIGPLVNEQSYHFQLMSLFYLSIGLTVIFVHAYYTQTHRRLATLMLFAFWLVGYVTIDVSLQRAEESDQLRFDILTERTQHLIQHAFDDLTNTLSATSGLFYASQHVDANEFKTFAKEINVINLRKGVRGLGYVQKVDVSHIKQYFALAAQDGLPHPQLIPHQNANIFETNRFYHAPIKYLEPQTTRSEQLIGVDMTTESTRRHAIEVARDTGRPAMTDPLTLSQAQGLGEQSFIYVFPLYQSGKVPESETERRKQVTGWIYLPFAISEFVDEKIGNEIPEVALDIYVGHMIKAEKLVYSQHLPENVTYTNQDYDKIDAAEFGQLIFMFGWHRTNLFISNKDLNSSWIIALSTILGILMASLVQSIQSTREKAEELASKRLEELETQRAIATHMSSMATLGVMAGGIAHEVNNPLAIIQGTARHVRMMYERNNFDRERALKDLNIIEETTLRIARIIKGLRSIARMGDRDPLEPTSLNTIIEDVASVTRAKFSSSDIELMLPSDAAVTIQCRSTQISQVLLNLLTNAYDAVLSLPEKWVKVSVEDNDSHVIIRVTDSGKGMPAAIIQRIMEPFFTTKEVGQGTGLGLSISKSIVEDHGGTIHVDQGSVNTCFVVTLPKVQADGKTA